MARSSRSSRSPRRPGSLFGTFPPHVTEALAELTYCNPFRPRRIELERRALGAAFVEDRDPWNTRGDLVGSDSNLTRLIELAERVAGESERSLRSGIRPSALELERREDIALFVLYHRWRERLDAAAEARSRSASSPDSTSSPVGPDASGSAQPTGRISFAAAFHADVAALLAPHGATSATVDGWGHLLACFDQIVRAFRSIFRCVIGVSEPTWRFRAAVWESIFTHDMRRYRRVLHRRMADIVTLITGPSGTGKELAAQAIGMARYIPFDPRTSRFVEDATTSFHALNLSALSPTLIESELFGHRRGAFTGALSDRAGWLEVCPELGTIFLDEIGELDPAIQVKLLRVLQSRTFSRIGESAPRRFRGKIIAATNRDLGAAVRAGLVREDFYYRLCADIVEVPSLRLRLDAHPGELDALLRFITARVLPDDPETLASEVRASIVEHLGPEYPWPGNVRELEQCVANVLIRGTYRPGLGVDDGGHDESSDLLDRMRRGALTAEELLRAYVVMVHRATGSFEETARRLDLDRRTVRARVRAGSG